MRKQINDTNYSINERGIVRNEKSGRDLITQTDSKGYEYVSLRIGGKYKPERIHRLLAAAFIPNPENKPHINHKNGVRNDNKIENLEWCTPSENHIHRATTLKHFSPKGTPNKRTRPLIIIHPNGNKELSDGISWAARKLNINTGDISNVLRGKRRHYKGYKFEAA